MTDKDEHIDPDIAKASVRAGMRRANLQTSMDMLEKEILVSNAAPPQMGDALAHGEIGLRLNVAVKNKGKTPGGANGMGHEMPDADVPSQELPDEDAVSLLDVLQYHFDDFMVKSYASMVVISVLTFAVVFFGGILLLVFSKAEGLNSDGSEPEAPDVIDFSKYFPTPSPTEYGSTRRVGSSSGGSSKPPTPDATLGESMWYAWTMLNDPAVTNARLLACLFMLTMLTRLALRHIAPTPVPFGSPASS